MKKQRTIHLALVALLAVVMTAAGVPAMVCASMSDCPMMQPVTPSCHGTDDSRPAPHRIDTRNACCEMSAESPVSTPGIQPATVHLLDVAVPADAVAEPIAELAPPVPLTRDTGPRDGPAGRSLLSLHQTLLI